MASYNKVILMGNLVRDPETRTSSNGNPICSFSIAVNRRVKQGDNWTDEASYFDVDAFGREAETISRYMSKGRPILIEGRLQQDRWQDPQGNNRSKVKVVCERFTFVGGREDGGGNGNSGTTRDYNQSAPAPRQAGNYAANDGGDIEDDVPF